MHQITPFSKVKLIIPHQKETVKAFALKKSDFAPILKDKSTKVLFSPLFWLILSPNWS
jgi:hypothetical protein